jgi:hypothetical protein
LRSAQLGIWIGLGNGDSDIGSMQVRVVSAIHDVTIVPVKDNPRLECPARTVGSVATPATGLQFCVAVHAVWAIIGVT